MPNCPKSRQAAGLNTTVPTVSTNAAIAAIFLTVVGAAGFLVLPVILGAAVGDLALAADQVGLLGSSLLMGSAVSAIGAAMLVRRLNWRWLAYAALALEWIGFLLSSQVDSYPHIMLPLFLASCGGGATLSLALTVLSDHPKAERMFGFSLTMQVAFQVVGLLMLSWFMVPGRLDLCLNVLAVLAVMGLCVVPLLPKHGVVIATSEHMSAADILKQPLGLLSLVGCLLFFVNIGAVWAYVERMGSASEISPRLLGQALAGGVATGMLGSLAAAWQGRRLGYALPLAIAVVGTLIALFLMQVPMTFVDFLLAFALYNFFWNYSLTYQYAVVTSVDQSGRYIAATPAFHALGGALGPIAAAMFVTQNSLLPINYVAGFAVILSLAAFYPATSASPDSWVNAKRNRRFS